MKRTYVISEDEVRQAISEWFLRHHEYRVDPYEGVRFLIEIECECEPEDTGLGEITANITTEDKPIGAES